jgi:DNA modification methylase
MQKPYFTDGKRTIYHSDCREILPTLPKFDVLLTDPPYGILKETGSAATRRQGGNLDQGKMQWDSAITLEDCEMLKRSAELLMIWGGNHFELGVTRGWLVWDKQNDGLNFGECEYCWTNMEFAPRIHRQWCVNIDGLRIHPTQKPIGLMKFCLSFCKEAKTIVDPYAGVGSTLIAAKELGLECVGIEREESFCESAANRLRQDVFQW